MATDHHSIVWGSWNTYAHDGWIYAAQEVGTPLVKVGHTLGRNPVHRLKNLAYEHGSAMEFIAASHVTHWAYKIERVAHYLLQPYCIENEWFYLHVNAQTLRALIEQAVLLVNDQIESVVHRSFPHFPLAEIDTDYKIKAWDRLIYGSHQ